jgi:hypothetical protein
MQMPVKDNLRIFSLPSGSGKSRGHITLRLGAFRTAYSPTTHSTRTPDSNPAVSPAGLLSASNGRRGVASFFHGRKFPQNVSVDIQQISDL